MIKVLIVEDEYLVRVGLHTCIDWEAQGFVLLSDATDGMDALTKINALKPDIVLLDLRMPRMSGLELLEKLQQQHITVSVIVLSCCDDFESVRTALRYGVADYVNKLTMTPDELLAVLRRSASRLSVRQDDAERSDITSVGNQAALETLLKKPSAFAGPLPEGFETGRLCCLLVLPVNGMEVSLSVRKSMIQQVLKNGGIESAACASGDALWVMLPGGVEYLRIATLLRQGLESTLSCRCFLGFSPLWNKPEDLPACHSLASQITNELFWHREEGSVRTYEEPLACTEEQRERYLELKALLHEQCSIGNFPGVLQTAEEYFEYFLSQETFPQEDFVKFTLSLLDTFPYDRDSAQAKSYFHYQATIVRAQSAQTVQKTFLEFVHRYAADFSLGLQHNYSPITTQAINYIINNPSAPVQLSEVAHAINVSDSYLSQLFKKDTGMNFVYYVHRYKMRLAKQMLDESMLIYQVCEKIGFENSSYFAKIFKRFHGVSPTEYKSKGKRSAP